MGQLMNIDFIQGKINKILVNLGIKQFQVAQYSKHGYSNNPPIFVIENCKNPDQYVVGMLAKAYIWNIPMGYKFPSNINNTWYIITRTK